VVSGALCVEEKLAGCTLSSARGCISPRAFLVQTKDVNVADEESNEEAVLLTNVLDLSMSNHQQPKIPTNIKPY